MTVARLLLIVGAFMLQAAALAGDQTFDPAVAREFEQIAAAHRALRAYDLRIDVNYSPGGQMRIVQARVACVDQRRCLRIFQNATTLETAEMSLVVDANNHTIVVAARETTSAPSVAEQQVDPTRQIESWIAGGGSLSGGEQTQDGRRWVFRPAKPSLPTVEIYVDPSSHLLRRLVYAGVGNEGPQVDIRYTWGDGSRLDPADFEVNRYIEGQDASIMPAQGYATYRIIRADHH